MTNFEKSCQDFKKRNGYLTAKQQRVLDKIKKERKLRKIVTPPKSEWDRESDMNFASAFDWGSQ